MGHLVCVATCSLRNWALDFEGNTKRIIESIHKAKAAGATLRVGPELEICGYSCLDHFFEADLYLHCWEMLCIILKDRSCDGILLDIGMPVMHRNNRFNCRVICLNGKILLIRPKLWLANDGIYREMRHFIPWVGPRHVEEYYLPRMVKKIQGTTKVPIGDAVISTTDTCVGMETCEELFTPQSPHNDMSLNGVEIMTNSSGSHHTLRKLHVRVSLILEATRKNGGIYLYSNHLGCDGDRLYFDGSAMIIVNGSLVAQGNQFTLDDVDVVTAVIDLEEVRSYRCTPSRGHQAMKAGVYTRVETEFSLSSDIGDRDTSLRPSLVIEPRYYYPEEEIALSTGCWLWDYLRRSGTAGYLLPLSGGIDSCATAMTVFSMCQLVIDAIKAGNEQVIKDCKRLADYTLELPNTPQELCHQLFHTIYMGMSKQSSKETRERARELSKAIGSYHIDLDIDDVYEAQKNLVVKYLDFDPKFRSQGGTNAENLMLQNIQARSRMVTAYEFAQLLPTTRKRPHGGALLVLGSANVGEALRGYYTKYDCSSADINPIGGLDKSDLKRFIAWAEKSYAIPCLRGFLEATPTAELEPITEQYVQSDEADMGMTYDELTTFGRLRKCNKLGPYGMFQRLVHDWNHLTPQQVAEKVKRFYHYYAINRHKMTTLTPALHSNDYSPDDNRFDLRPFLYFPFYQSWGFKKIDEELAHIKKQAKQ
ncbi:glutamine-dependent NAD(+) synthetase [Nannizzia gypsea CBS 118893]|uniref:Glutamine-dependent NAD(+) synthetase n=1 Tax=Arthroderma gypseum (strain ATCC MYA-4604 / CBS 118893) TaxID=535722 RepID=E5QYW3_ARTGP|nr:glutamine-dependent NAD(+) synthetase [Nannizzia gypsea CBS 118893]EFQ98086.1 glutamine-dependent NAD(+) synthetase [Nannizzia gypsea CBS 118893]